MSNFTNYYRTLHNDISVPQPHINYLPTIGYTPRVIYDIGAAVLHWTKEAKKVWPQAKYYAFEAVMEVEDWFNEYGIEHYLGVLSDQDNKEVTFYEDAVCLGGNSYYRENTVYSPAAEKLYSDEKGNKRVAMSLDTIVKEKGFELPDFMKIDVQGAELDILKGATETLQNVKHLIVELQHVEYNIGAKQVQESIPFIQSLGFELVPAPQVYFCGNGPDADYHFMRIQ